MTNGICTLANDVVCDQLIALLNSIEAIYGTQMPVCVYPYNDKTEKIAAEIARRPNVQLYDDRASIQAWDEFYQAVWDAHPNAQQCWKAKGFDTNYRFGIHRRMCAFDGPFDRFLYMDADTILMNRIEPFFEQLDRADWVVYDFQYKDLSHVYNVSSPRLTEVFSQERIDSEIFCSGLYATKKGIFDRAKCEEVLAQLRSGEAEILYIWASDQTALNYMAMKSNLKLYNFALQLPKEQVTGCCVTSSHFEEKEHVLYDRGRQLTYLHYIGISSSAFTRLCAGKNLDLPYRDIFLHYRYLHEPEQQPNFSGKPQPYNPPPSLQQRVFRKLGVRC